MLVDFEHKTSATLGKIHALLSQLATCETVITSRFQDHTGAFRDLEAELSLGRHGRKCTWLTECRFLAAVKHEALIRRTLGQALSDWSDELSLLDSTRIDSIKHHMLRFLTYQSELFLQIPENAQVSAVLESVSSSRTETKFLSNEETEALAMISGGDTDPFRTMKEWSPKEAPRTHLVVKMGWIHKETGVFRQWQRCFAVLTNTHFMHFFNVEDLEPFPDPILSVFLCNYKIFVSGDDFVFDLVETKQTRLLSLVSSPSL